MPLLNPIFETVFAGGIMLVGFTLGSKLHQGAQFLARNTEYLRDDRISLRLKNMQHKARFNIPAFSLNNWAIGLTSMVPFEAELIDRLVLFPVQASNPPIRYALAQRLADTKPGPEIPFDERIAYPRIWSAKDYWTGPAPKFWHAHFGPGTLWCTGKPLQPRRPYAPAVTGDRRADHAIADAKRRMRHEQLVEYLAVLDPDIGAGSVRNSVVVGQRMMRDYAASAGSVPKQMNLLGAEVAAARNITVPEKVKE